MRNELFASTRFAFDENRGVGGGHGLNLVQYSTERRARPLISLFLIGPL